MTDRNLEEAIYQLQKLNTENGIKQLVEEAAQLYSGGRHIEAGALMEKAEAMMAAAATGHPVPVATHAAVSHSNTSHAAAPPATTSSKEPERAKIDEQITVQIAGKLADGLAKILIGAFHELEIHLVGESRKVAHSFQEQLERLRATVESLVQLQNKFEHLAEAVSEQRSSSGAVGEKYDQLAQTVTSLEQTTSRHQSELGALRGETKDLSAMVGQQVDTLAARLGLHQEELTGLKTTVSDISRKVAGFIERLDRQAEVIRSLSDVQARRAAALDDVLGVLTRLNTPEQQLVAAAGQI